MLQPGSCENVTWSAVRKRDVVSGAVDIGGHAIVTAYLAGGPPGRIIYICDVGLSLNVEGLGVLLGCAGLCWDAEKHGEWFSIENCFIGVSSSGGC